MSSSKKWIKIAAIAALIIIPTVFIFILARAQWVNQPLPYLGNSVKNEKGEEIHHTVSDFLFTDQHGKPVTLDSFKDQIIVANIFFATCPEVCPEMNGQIQVVAEEYATFNNVRFLSVSINPESDSVPSLLKYSQRFNPRLKNWRFCTGNKSEIYDWVLNDLLLANEMRGSEFIHDDKVVVIDKERHIRAILPTRPPENTPANRMNTVKLELVKNIRDDIDNLLYDYRKKELDK
jgi:protein SCO1/2